MQLNPDQGKEPSVSSGSGRPEAVRYIMSNDVFTCLSGLSAMANCKTPALVSSLLDELFHGAPDTGTDFKNFLRSEWPKVPLKRERSTYIAFTPELKKQLDDCAFKFGFEGNRTAALRALVVFFAIRRRVIRDVSFTPYEWNAA